MYEIDEANKKKIADMLYELYQQKRITKEQLQDRLEELKSLVLMYVLRFNDAASTSLSREHYEEVCNALQFLFDHGGRLEKNPQLSLADLLKKGEQQIGSELRSIRKMHAFLQEEKPYFYSDSFQGVIEDTEVLMKQWNSTKGWLFYGKMSRDFLYPLADGPALFHHMYDRNGVDFVSYYLRRMCVECRFCLHFKKELLPFYKSFRVSKGFSIREIDLNLSVMFMRQCIVSYLLHGRISILLTENDLIRMERLLTVRSDFPEIIKRSFHHVTDCFDTEIQTYFLQYQEEVLSFFRKDLSLHDALIIQRKEKSKNAVYVQGYASSFSIERVLENLHRCHSMAEAIDLLFQIGPGICDWIDLMENWLLNEEEIVQLFKRMDIYSMAALLKALCQEYCVLTPEDLRKDADRSWINSFLGFIEENCSEVYTISDKIIIL